MNLNQLFNDLSADLQRRTVLMTEDTVRYYFYNCMLRQDKKINHYVLELPYQELLANPTRYCAQIPSTTSLIRNSKGSLEQELDIYYEDPSIDSMCIELKFHRNAPHSSYAHTSAAGDLFNDLQRLQQIKPVKTICKRLLVYVTDDVMGNYLSGFSGSGKSGGIKNPIAGAELKKFYNNPTGVFQINIAHPTAAPNTFFTSSSKSFTSKSSISIGLNMVYTNDFICPALGGRCHLRVYEVL